MAADSWRTSGCGDGGRTAARGSADGGGGELSGGEAWQKGVSFAATRVGERSQTGDGSGAKTWRQAGRGEQPCGGCVHKEQWRT